MADGKRHNVKFDFDEQSYAALLQLHEDYGRDDGTELGKTLRDALALAVYISQRLKEGCTMQFEHEGIIITPPAEMLPGKKR